MCFASVVVSNKGINKRNQSNDNKKINNNVEISSDAHSTPHTTLVQLIVDDIVCFFFFFFTLFTFLINLYKSYAADDGDAHTQIHHCSVSMSSLQQLLEAIRNTEFIRKMIFFDQQKIKMDVIFQMYASFVTPNNQTARLFRITINFCWFFLLFCVFLDYFFLSGVRVSTRK